MLIDQKLITCVLPKGIAAPLIHRLKEEKGIISCNINNARGTGHAIHHRDQGIGNFIEKELLSVVTTPEQADDIFEFLFYEADINQPHGGIMYMTKLKQAGSFELPDLPDEEGT